MENPKEIYDNGDIIAFFKKHMPVLTPEQIELMKHNEQYCENINYLKSTPEDNYNLEEFLQTLPSSQN
jgi:hypothetical protein